MTIVQEESGSVGVGSSKSMLNKGREAKLGENSREVGVRDSVVGFFLIKEDQRTIHRTAVGRIQVRGSLISGMAKDIMNSHGNISGISIVNEAGLMRRNQIRENGREP